MPTGPQGQKRPVSDTACATHVMKMATGQIIKEKVELPPRRRKPKVRNGKDEPRQPPLMVGSGLPPLL